MSEFELWVSGVTNLAGCFPLKCLLTLRNATATFRVLLNLNSIASWLLICCFWAVVVQFILDPMRVGSFGSNASAHPAYKQTAMH